MYIFTVTLKLCYLNACHYLDRKMVLDTLPDVDYRLLLHINIKVYAFFVDVSCPKCHIATMVCCFT